MLCSSWWGKGEAKRDGREEGAVVRTDPSTIVSQLRTSGKRLPKSLHSFLDVNKLRSFLMH